VLLPIVGSPLTLTSVRRVCVTRNCDRSSTHLTQKAVAALTATVPSYNVLTCYAFAAVRHPQ